MTSSGVGSRSVYSFTINPRYFSLVSSNRTNIEGKTEDAATVVFIYTQRPRNELSVIVLEEKKDIVGRWGVRVLLECLRLWEGQNEERGREDPGELAARYVRRGALRPPSPLSCFFPLTFHPS